MLIERLANRSPVFGVNWNEFKAEWVKADDAHKTVLGDGRPAVRHDGEPDSYITVHPVVWDIVKPQLAKMFQNQRPPKRVRFCEACHGELEVKYEQEEVWIFKCPRCASVEIHGKDLIGGTRGAGEKEKT